MTIINDFFKSNKWACKHHVHFLYSRGKSNMNSIYDNEEYSHKVSYHSNSEYDSLYTEHLKQEGDNNDYIRCEYITVNLQCELVRHSKRLSFTPSLNDTDELGNEVLLDPDYRRTERVELIGHIGKSRLGGWHSFSFFGSSNRINSINVDLATIEGGATAGAIIYGLEASHDFDFDSEEELSISIGMPEEQYSYYVAHLLERGSKLQITLKLDQCLQCFTSWSPSIDEGRIIKYLGHNVGNALKQDFKIPGTFYTEELKSLEYSLALVNFYGTVKKKRWEETLEDIEDDILADDCEVLEDELKAGADKGDDRYTLDIYMSLLSDSKKSTLRWKLIACVATILLGISFLSNA